MPCDKSKSNCDKIGFLVCSTVLYWKYSLPSKITLSASAQKVSLCFSNPILGSNLYFLFPYTNSLKIAILL